MNNTDPLILFVPGATKPHWLVPSKVADKMKQHYFEDQKSDVHERGRNFYDMNDSANFDSDRRTIQANADAIAAFLRNKQQENPDNRVTIVSHSKGCQDVLHALVELENEKELPYRGGSAIPGKPKNRSLWQTVAGWVAFQSNYFESEFEIEESKRASQTAPADHLADDCSNAYADYLPPDFPDRLQYMFNHRHAIADLMASVRTICAYSSFIPKVGNYAGTPLNKMNDLIRDRAKVSGLCGANDGIVPARAAQLPGATIVKLPDDPDASAWWFFKKHGADHFAPAFRWAWQNGREFWRAPFRKKKTWEYILQVESRGELTAAP